MEAAIGGVGFMRSLVCALLQLTILLGELGAVERLIGNSKCLLHVRMLYGCDEGGETPQRLYSECTKK